MRAAACEVEADGDPVAREQHRGDGGADLACSGHQEEGAGGEFKEGYDNGGGPNHGIG